MKCEDCGKVYKEPYKKNIVRLIINILILFTLIGIVSWSLSNIEPLRAEPPVAKNGYIQLANWDMDTQGNIRLDGDWEFYWNQLISPGEFELPVAQMTGYFPVPLYWTKYEDLNLYPKGNATYRVFIDTQKVYKILSIKISEIYTDYSLYVNGEKIYSHGSFNNRTPIYLKPEIYTFTNHTNKIEIVLQIKNSAHFNAGIGKSLTIGTPENIHKERNTKTAVDLIIFTICICAGFYHIILFSFRRSDYHLLCFSALSIITAIRDLFANEVYIMQMVPYLPFIIGSKIVHALIPLMAVCLIAYTYLTFKDAISKKFMYLIMGISTFYLFIVLLTSSYLYTFLANYYFFVFMIAIFMMLYISILKYRNGVSGALIFAFGVIFLLIGVINDMLYYHKLINTGYWFSMAVTMFIITQSIILSKQYANLIIEKRELYEKLTETNLSFMQAQIKPHFIYNALSTISYLSTKRPFQAKELILDLSDYLRGAFEFDDNKGMTVLSKEIDLIKAYLSIEKERYGNRLAIEYNITENLNVIIPRFSIQPIVENAIRHGIMNKIEGGIVKISILNIGHATNIIVEDSGVGMSEEKVEALLKDTNMGVGIRNVNNRLKLLYGKGITIKSIINEGTKIEMIIPHDTCKEGDV